VTTQTAALADTAMVSAMVGSAILAMAMSSTTSTKAVRMATIAR
jgi:hypothetical protein